MRIVLITDYGVKILSDSYEVIELNGNQVAIAGIDDPDKLEYEDIYYDQEASMETAFENLEQIAAYKILLAHRPELIEQYEKFPFDLVLSGHTHGGQFWLPFLLNGFYAPNQGFFPKYAGGLYQHQNLVHVISRGVSFNPRLPRIFNPPEIVVIDIL